MLSDVWYSLSVMMMTFLTDFSVSSIKIFGALMIHDRGPHVDHVHLMVHPFLAEYIVTVFKRSNLAATV